MELIELAIVGFATGIGNVLGTYITTKYIISHLDIIKDKLKEAMNYEHNTRIEEAKEGNTIPTKAKETTNV